ncbi:DUF2304 domain-containing protein [Vallitaleaceae bacterium 9-2]
MSIWVNVGSIVVGVTLIIYILMQIVNRKMTESQSVLWLFMGGIAIILGFFPGIINWVAKQLGIWYPPSIFLLFLVIGILFIVLKNTIVTSVQNNQLNELFIQVALLKRDNQELRAELNALKKEGDNNENTSI